MIYDCFTFFNELDLLEIRLNVLKDVVMTRISNIVPFVEKFKVGEVVDSLANLPAAVDRIRANCSQYQSGLQAFADHFDCERYYSL